MNILAAIPVYNEIDYLPLKIKWCQANGLMVYVLDNYSTDGTWEYIQSIQHQLVGTGRVDTDDSFDLRIIQDRLMREVSDIEPDWLVYVGADLFPVTGERLDLTIQQAYQDGYECISLPVCNFNNTGEKPKTFDPLNTFYFIEVGGPVEMIARYRPNLNMKGDYVGKDGQKVFRPEGVYFNFGFTKSKARREETYRRRQKAWQNGLRHQTGRHYTRADKHHFLWKKEDCADIRTHPLNRYRLFLMEQLKDIRTYHPFYTKKSLYVQKGDE